MAGAAATKAGVAKHCPELRRRVPDYRSEIQQLRAELRELDWRLFHAERAVADERFVRQGLAAVVTACLAIIGAVALMLQFLPAG